MELMSRGASACPGHMASQNLARSAATPIGHDDDPHDSPARGCLCVAGAAERNEWRTPTDRSHAPLAAERLTVGAGVPEGALAPPARRHTPGGYVAVGTRGPPHPTCRTNSKQGVRIRISKLDSTFGGKDRTRL